MFQLLGQGTLGLFLGQLLEVQYLLCRRRSIYCLSALSFLLYQ